MRTFPKGSPIVIDDIVFAAKIDGYDLSCVSSHRISEILKRHCRTEPGQYGNKDRRSYRRVD